ncbi:hypothetical protein JCM11957_07020 [Caminibacter profundus]
MRDSFVFYRSYYEAIELLPKAQRADAYKAIFEFMFNGKDISDELPNTAKAIFMMAKPTLEASNKKYEAGKKGAEIKKANKEKANNKQDESKQEATLEANNKQDGSNVNVNDNVNENVNIKEKEKSKKEKEESTSDFQTFVKVWNESAKKFDLPKVEKLSNERKRKLKRRIKNNKDFLEDFKRALEELEFSSFLRGENKNNWKMKFDWLIENDTNIIKVIEGQYRDKESDSKPEYGVMLDRPSISFY